MGFHKWILCLQREGKTWHFAKKKVLSALVTSVPLWGRRIEDSEMSCTESIHYMMWTMDREYLSLTNGSKEATSLFKYILHLCFAHESWFGSQCYSCKISLNDSFLWALPQESLFFFFRCTSINIQTSKPLQEVKPCH